MRNLIIILLGILPEVLVAQNLGRNANLDSLDSYIAKQNFYDLRKEEKIHSVEKQIAENQRDNQKLYLLLGDLYNEYQSYIYDSAYVCAEKLLGIANSLNDNDKIVEAKVKIGFCYLSAGLYKEAFDILENISVKNCTVPTKIEFFICKSRLYYDLADYNRGKNFIEKYNAEGNVLLDSALNILPKNSAKYWATMALLQMKSENFQQAIDAFERLINQKESSQHDIAIATSSIAYILTLQGKKPDAQNYLVRAAIADIQSSVKETVALRNLAQLLYENGDIEHATIYVRKALQDAMFYNARQRQLEIGAILPIIEGERIKNIENQRKKMIFVSIGVGLLALILLVA
ncbi:MAG: DUF6377 domain-containing protein, partial [Prevotellaceae bacterium]|nr:DUF6377 domain-containing protein [Prevotellaceae bacterium]